MNRKKFLILVIVIVSSMLFWQVFLRDLNVTGKAFLSWNSSDDTSIKGYKIYYGKEKRKGDCPKDGGYEKKVDIGNKTSYEINDLNDSATYYFSVTSYNTSGKESCFSEEISKVVKLSIFDKIKIAIKK